MIKRTLRLLLILTMLTTSKALAEEIVTTPEVASDVEQIQQIDANIKPENEILQEPIQNNNDNSQSNSIPGYNVNDLIINEVARPDDKNSAKVEDKKDKQTSDRVTPSEYAMTDELRKMIEDMSSANRNDTGSDITENLTGDNKLNSTTDKNTTVNTMNTNKKYFSLMYHRLSDTEAADEYTIPPKTFEDDIKYLKDNGYTFCTADEFRKNITDGVEGKFVAITFDDGYISDLKLALPILEKYSAKATFFVIGSNIGTEGYMTHKELAELSESENVQIGNHTYLLHNMEATDVKTAYSNNYDEVFRDFQMNSMILEYITGKKITAASFPYGIYNITVEKMLENVGYTTFSSDETSPKSDVRPYGRYNRSYASVFEDVIEKAIKTPEPKKDVKDESQNTADSGKNTEKNTETNNIKSSKYDKLQGAYINGYKIELEQRNFPGSIIK